MCVDERSYGRQRGGDRSAAERESQPREISAVEQQHESIAEAVGVARTHGVRNGAQPPAHLFLVRAHERAQFVLVVGDFHRGVAERAAAAAAGFGMVQLRLEQSLYLTARIIVIASHGGIPPRPILAFLFLQIFGDQRVLRREAAVKAHLVGAGFRCYGIDAHAAYAVTVKQVAGSLEDAVAHPRLAGGWGAWGLCFRGAHAWFVAAHGSRPTAE